jgi:ribosomal protein S25
MRETTEQIAAAVLRALDHKEALTLEQIAERVCIGKGLACTLVRQLKKYNVVEQYKHNGKYTFALTGQMCACDICSQEIWILGAD